AFVGRNEKRFDGRGGGGVLSSGTGGGFFVRAQAGDAAGLEDALHGGADGSVADQRSLAKERGARQPDGATAGAGIEEDSANLDCVPGGSERGVCANSSGGNPEDPGTVFLLCLERRGVAGALDVLVRHDRRGRPGVHGVCGSSGGGRPELKPPRWARLWGRIRSPALWAEDRRTHFLPALTLAHRARCAAAILLRPATEIVRFLRVAAGPRLLPCRKNFPKVLRAAVTRWSSSSSRARSCWSCLTTD